VVNAKDIWSLAKMRKGQPTKVFPPLKDTDRKLVNKPDQKSKIFRCQFFLMEPQPVKPTQMTDSPPQSMGKWDPVTEQEIITAIEIISAFSAPSLSRVGYQLLS